MNLINDAMAMAQQAQGQQGGGGMMAWLPLIAILFVIYFLMIRPVSKRQKEHRKFVDSLNKGDEVITDSGIIGRITGITDGVVTLEVSDNVKIKILKYKISAPKKSIEKPQTQTK